MRYLSAMPVITRIIDQIYDMKAGAKKPVVFFTKSPRSIRATASRLGKKYDRTYTCRERPDGAIEVWRLH